MRGRQVAAPAEAADADRSESTRSEWGFAEGAEITPGRTAITRLGGGLRYEAYLSWDARLRSLVVVKIVRPALVEDERTLRGLAAEAEMLARANHPVVVRGFGAELDSPRPHLTLEHLDGPRLSSLVRKHGPLLSDQLASLGIQLAAAAHYLQSEGIVHLDIKPSNVIMGAPSRLIDLSVACTTEEAAALTATVGTAAFMAPEQADPGGRLAIDAPADVWGIGATLYQGLTGQRPFPKRDPESELRADRFPQLAGPPIEPDRKLPRSLVEPIMACLDPDPAARPTAAALGDQLEVVLEAEPEMRLGRLKPRFRR